MKMALAKFFPVLTQENIYIFLLGMFWALVFLAGLFILTGLFWLIFRRSKSVDGITLDTAHGSLFISASAIADLVYSLDDRFSELEITRVRLVRENGQIAIRVNVFYTAGGQSMLELAETFQTQAMERLKSAFGIDNISRIDLIVPKSKI